MEFSVSKADLVRELNLSQAIVDKKTTIPILSNILFQANGDRVVLTATDLELGLQSSCPARVQKAGAGTIPAKRLLEYVALLPEAEIHVKFLENQWASLVCGRSRTRIAGISAENYPELPAMPDPVAEFPLSTLAALINRTGFAISVEDSRFSLGGALLIVKEQSLAMVSTDGHRLAYAESAGELPGFRAPYRALVPRKAMDELRKLAQDAAPETMVRFAGDENHLFFQTGGRLFVSRRLSGNFPDFERVLPREHPHSVVLSREEFRTAVQRVQVFSDERSRAIRLQMAPGELKIHSSLSEAGESEESVAAQYDGPTVEVTFNAHYLTDFLRAVTNEKVVFQFRDREAAGEFNPSGEPADFLYRYIVMPMRV